MTTPPSPPHLHIVQTERLAEFIGCELGPTEWVPIMQDMVNQFADLTRDHNFIHVDVEAARSTPFGGTIAHGFLTLSMLAWIMGQANVVPANAVIGMNYGLNRVRFLEPVACGARVRGHVKPLAFEGKAGRMLVTLEVTVEIEGKSKPALIAEALALYMLKQSDL
jgi:acyl dehydratase